MYVVIRTYSGQGGSELFDALTERAEDVRDVISTVPGFTSYEAFRTDGGGQTVTVCQDKAGTDESSRRAAEWVKENISVTVDPPTVTEGSTSSTSRSSSVCAVNGPGRSLTRARRVGISVTPLRYCVTNGQVPTSARRRLFVATAGRSSASPAR